MSKAENYKGTDALLNFMDAYVIMAHSSKKASNDKGNFYLVDKRMFENAASCYLKLLDEIDKPT